jgi:hypothetical protein
MPAALTTIGRVLARSWPALLAWYLGGVVVRSAVIAVAAPIGPELPLLGLLLVPIAVLARLVSYVGMFMALRDGLRHARPDRDELPWREQLREYLSVLTATIAPFFTLYAILGLLQDDLESYASAAVRYGAFSENPTIIAVGGGPEVLLVVVVAFGGTQLLKVLRDRTPRWLEVLAVYLEATWVFVALTAITSLFGPIVEWISQRQVVRWVADVQEFVIGLWEPIRVFLDSLGWVIPVASQVLLLPLAWLLITGIVLVKALPGVEEQRIGMPMRLRVRLRLAAQSVPPVVRTLSPLITDTWDETGRPVAFVGRIIGGAGALRLAVFAGAYALVYAAGQWLQRAGYWLAGPHESAFWFAWDPLIDTVVSLITEPLRIVLLAVVFDAALGRWLRRLAERQGATGSLTRDRPSSVSSSSSSSTPES